MKPSSRPRRAQSPARHWLSASRWLGPGSEVRNAAAAPHLRVVAAAPDAACQGQPAARPRPARPPSPGRPHFRPSGQSQSPPTRRRRVPERGSIPDGVWASESFRLSSDPLAVQPCQAKAGWALPSAGPVPLATARTTAPHSGQTALRHFEGASWLWAEFAKSPLTLQYAHSSFSPITFHRKNPLPSTSYPQFVFEESYSPQNASCI